MLTIALTLWAAITNATPDTVRLQFVGHSGWLIEVGETAVLIDPVGTTEDGRVDAARQPRFPNSPNIVIVSHGHADHYAQTFIRSMITAGIPVVVGHDIDTLAAATVLRPRATETIGGVRLTAIESTDAGIGVLIEIGGFRIYHGGDHALWTDALSGSYRAEIDWLAQKVGSVDVVLVAVATGQRCEIRPSLLEGIHYAATRLNARMIVPMHLQCMDRLAGVVQTLREEIVPGGPMVRAPERVGSTLWFSKPQQ